jgi:hypothetical protein
MQSPRTKSDYFAVSESLDLPMRCPLLRHCERRAHTIALANRWPLEEAAKRVDLRAPIVKSIGEGSYQIGGENNFVSGGQCPEVNLFETTVALPGFAGQATTKGAYDKYIDPQFKILETGHFSGCAEYASVAAKFSQSDEKQHSWLRRNYQWVVGTLVAIAGTIAAFLALK